MDISKLRHEKENMYLPIVLVIGGLVWAGIILGTLGMIFVFLIPLAIVLFIAERMMRAILFGNAVQVTEKQFPDIHNVVKRCASDLGLDSLPAVFVVNSGGATNAVAVKFLKNRYVILYSEIVDLMNATGDTNRLKMIIGHELAHHAAGHVNFFRNLIIKPAIFIPFLGAAYSRARELTADRISCAWVGEEKSCKEALIDIACGSDILSNSINIEAFKDQEMLVPPIIGFLHELFATHPRLTRRVIEIERYFAYGSPMMAPTLQGSPA